jgi:tetratricopeptide (TPR) repeat protein
MSDTQSNLNGPARWRIAVVGGLVLLLAFLLASFPARNSEVWRHLATGRALLDGTYTFGADPFAYTTEGVTWVNHSWLWDLVLYAVYQCCGERAVILNALLALALAVFMLLGAGVAKYPWTASLSVALGLVCIGPHLILGPMVVTYVLFAFTLWWLGRTENWSVRAHWPMFLAFIVWANSSEVFFLGPMTVALFWLEGLHRDRKATGWRGPLIVLATSVAVCLLNPHHVEILHRGSSGLSMDFLTQKYNEGLFKLVTTWHTIPVPLIALSLLGVLCILSFFANASAMLRPRTVVLFILLAISGYGSSEIVPFLAIFACPLMAANWQAYLERRDPERWQPSSRVAWLGSTAATTALLALVVSACPGWLQGSFEPRGWHLHADPSMKRVAEQLATWRQEGKLGEHSRGFNVSVDLAHYLEWFCPEEKVFLDGRRNLFPLEVVVEFHQVGRALTAETIEPAAWADARSVLRRWQCTHLVVADPADRRLAGTLRNLWQQPDEWALVDIHGRATVFAWTKPMHGKPPLRLAPVDLHRRAFDPALASTAPRQGAGREPQPRAWWDCFVWSEGNGVLDQDEAIIDLVHFEAMRPVYLERNRQIFEAEAIAAFLGTIAPHGSGIEPVAGCYPFALFEISRRPPRPSERTLLDVLAFQMITAHTQSSDQGPSGSLLLAVRAARRALHANPDDAFGHLRLGRAYERLQHHTAERGVVPGFPLLEQLRKIQALVALNRAVQLRPDLLSAHELLANLLLEARGFDLALPHVQAQLRLHRAAGPLPNETAQDFASRIDRLAHYELALGKQVREMLNRVDTQGFKLDVHGKARLAESSGLPGYALEQLLRSNYAEFGREGAILELHLLLHVGRTNHFRTMIDPAQEAAMGTFNFHWLQALLAAADGDYDQADEHLQRLIVRTVDLPDLRVREALPPQAFVLLLGEQILTGGSLNPAQPLLQVATLSPWQAPESRLFFLRRLESIARTARQDADLHTLRGLLALESGAIESAQRSYQAAVAVGNDADGSAQLARHYLRLIALK